MEDLSTNAGGGGQRKGVLPGIIWCLVGGFCAAFSPILAALVSGYGAAVSVERANARGQRGSAAAFATVVLLLGLYAFFSGGVVAGLDAAVNAAIPCLVAWVVGMLAATGRLSLRGVGIAIAAVTVFLVVVGEAECLVAGSHLPDVIEKTVESLQIGASSIRAQSQVNALLPMLASLWPTCFLVLGGVTVGCTLVGAWQAVKGNEDLLAKMPHLRELHFPTWVNTAVLVGLFGLVVSRLVAGMPELLAMVSLNVVMIARLAVAAEGIAVLLWFLHQKKAGPMFSLAAIAAAVYAEASFYVMSVVGFLDVLADFRHMYDDRSQGHKGSQPVSK